MDPLPHEYRVTLNNEPESSIEARVEDRLELNVGLPVQFDGAGDLWSPEDLFMASISSCFILSFRAVAKNAGFNWKHIHCESKGVLDKEQGKGIRFIGIFTVVELMLVNDEDKDKAVGLLEKSGRVCLISNSISAPHTFEFHFIDG